MIQYIVEPVKGAVVLDIREKLRLEEEARQRKNKEYYENNKEEMLEKSRNYYKNNKEKMKKINTQWRKDNPEKRRSHILKHYYGITLKEYDELLSKQDGKCAVCRTDTPGGKGRFVVDHCHKTGRNRGLLCHNCNMMVGNHSAELLIAGAEYIKAWEK